MLNKYKKYFYTYLLNFQINFMLQTAENFTLLDFKLANLERFELSYAQLAFYCKLPTYTKKKTQQK